jgi:hypothetical protein
VQVGSTLAATIEDQQLMPDQHGLTDNRMESAWLCQSRHRDHQMNEEEEVAHPGNRISTLKPPNSAQLVIRHGQERRRDAC